MENDRAVGLFDPGTRAAAAVPPPAVAPPATAPPFAFTAGGARNNPGGAAVPRPWRRPGRDPSERRRVAPRRRSTGGAPERGAPPPPLPLTPPSPVAGGGGGGDCGGGDCGGARLHPVALWLDRVQDLCCGPAPRSDDSDGGEDHPHPPEAPGVVAAAAPPGPAGVPRGGARPVAPWPARHKRQRLELQLYARRPRSESEDEEEDDYGGGDQEPEDAGEDDLLRSFQRGLTILHHPHEAAPETPIHTYAARRQGMCPLGHQEIILFES